MAERVNSQWIQGLCGGVPPAESWHENPQFAIYPRSADSVTITLTPDNGVDGTALWVLAADAPNQRKTEFKGFIDKAEGRDADPSRLTVRLEARPYIIFCAARRQGYTGGFTIEARGSSGARLEELIPAWNEQHMPSFAAAPAPATTTKSSYDTGSDEPPPPPQPPPPPIHPSEKYALPPGPPPTTTTTTKFSYSGSGEPPPPPPPMPPPAPPPPPPGMATRTRGGSEKDTYATPPEPPPDGWKTAYDQNGGMYYYNEQTRRAQYARPGNDDSHGGWRVARDGGGREYYWNENTFETTYEVRAATDPPETLSLSLSSHLPLTTSSHSHPPLSPS